eukprot:TRINITY_DN7719_c0_g1_i17.p1 TRINITY_DN7719_c0_g1~~TRINITY_DN7719_c0_g1_i17.p1  ORF type:complete len:137 (+),score=25.05 TRINITY_DN7719_c0_g1_i17:315-725(+)
MLNGNEQYYCSKCKTHRDSTKKLAIFRFPSILVLHLKRFTFDRFSRDKITTAVDFPLTALDLTQFTAADAPHPPGRYDLFAVANHMGSLGGGHYTAHGKTSSDSWHTFNDSSVSSVSASSIGGSSPYLLFYHRRSD